MSKKKHDFNYEDLYKTQILPLVNEIAKYSAINSMPFYFSCVTGNEDNITTYTQDGYLTGSTDIHLYYDCFVKYLLVGKLNLIPAAYVLQPDEQALSNDGISDGYSKKDIVVYRKTSSDILDYDCTDIYREHIIPIINTISDICSSISVPFYISCAVKNIHGKTDYAEFSNVDDNNRAGLYQDYFDIYPRVVKENLIPVPGITQFNEDTIGKDGMDYISNVKE